MPGPYGAAVPGSIFLLQPIPDLVHCLDLVRPAELFAQTGNVGVNGAQAFGVGDAAPDALIHHVAVKAPRRGCASKAPIDRIPDGAAPRGSPVPAGGVVDRVQHHVVGAAHVGETVGVSSDVVDELLSSGPR